MKRSTGFPDAGDREGILGRMKGNVQRHACGAGRSGETRQQEYSIKLR